MVFPGLGVNDRVVTYCPVSHDVDTDKPEVR